MVLSLQPVTTQTTMSEPPKPPVGESPKVAYDYGSNERPRMIPGEPKKHTVDTGAKEPPKKPVVQK